MIVAHYDHRGMAQPFAAALAAAGHTVFRADHEPDRDADVFLVDLDHDVYAWMIDRHERTILIPHGAGPVESPVRHPHIRGAFVVGEANLAFTDAAAVELVGWPWSPVRPFTPCPEPRRVLFAPTHPDNDGHVDGPWRAAEARALEQVLAAIPRQVTITYRPGPSTIQDTVAALTDGGYDLVVAAPGTLLAAATALGIPAVTYRQDLYGTPVGYPHDLIDGAAAVDAACLVGADEWRRQWVGDQFDPAQFVKTFKEAVSTW